MTTDAKTFTAADGDLLIRTDVAGPAARTGHRLTIILREWEATVSFDGETPTAVRASIVVDSLEVRSGEGGLTPMTGAERAIARGNALKSLNAKKFGTITFVATAVEATGTGYRLAGALTIGKQSRDQIVDIVVDDAGLSFDATVRQTDFGVKPYSLALGTLKVADEVRVGLAVRGG